MECIEPQWDEQIDTNAVLFVLIERILIPLLLFLIVFLFLLFRNLVIVCVCVSLWPFIENTPRDVL